MTHRTTNDAEIELFFIGEFNEGLFEESRLSGLERDPHSRLLKVIGRCDALN